jgi:hypothetical protein
VSPSTHLKTETDPVSEALSIYLEFRTMDKVHTPRDFEKQIPFIEIFQNSKQSYSMNDKNNNSSKMVDIKRMMGKASGRVDNPQQSLTWFHGCNAQCLIG